MKILKKSEKEFTGTEYEFTISGYDQKIIGTIKSYDNDESSYRYRWEVRFDYTYSENMLTSKMAPSAHSGITHEEAYQLMISYIESLSMPL